MRVPKKHLIIAIAFCLTVALAATILVLSSTATPSNSPAKLLKTVPIYPGASDIRWSSSPAPETLVNPSRLFREEAKVNFKTATKVEEVRQFYDDWFRSTGWRGSDSAGGGIYNKGGPQPAGLRLTPDGGPIFNGPWFEIMTEWPKDYTAVVYVDPIEDGNTYVSVSLERYRYLTPEEFENTEEPILTPIGTTNPLDVQTVAPPVPTQAIR